MTTTQNNEPGAESAQAQAQGDGAAGQELPSINELWQTGNFSPLAISADMLVNDLFVHIGTLENELQEARRTIAALSLVADLARSLYNAHFEHTWASSEWAQLHEALEALQEQGQEQANGEGQS